MDYEYHNLMMQEQHRDLINAEIKWCMARILSNPSQAIKDYLIGRIKELSNEVPEKDIDDNADEVGRLNWLTIDEYVIEQEKLIRR